MVEKWVVTTCDNCGKTFIQKDCTKNIDYSYMPMYLVKFKENVLGEFCCFDCLDKQLEDLIELASAKTDCPSSFGITIQQITLPYTCLEA